MAGTVEGAALSVERNAARVTSLLASGLDPKHKVRGFEWTIGQLGTHLASGGLAYEDIANGVSSPYLDLDERAAMNAQRLEADVHRDLRDLADAIDDSIRKVLEAVRTRPADDVVEWHQGIPMGPRPFLGAMVGELAFHGQDLARTVGVPWPIAREDAFPIVDFVNLVTPHILEPAKTRDLTATIELRVRDYDTATYAFERSRLTVTPGGGEKPQVTMSVDAVAFLQVAYKRSTLTRPILTGKAVAWGRRPWLALQFPGFFQNP
jgi:hypothetical protein